MPSSDNGDGAATFEEAALRFAQLVQERLEGQQESHAATLVFAETVAERLNLHEAYMDYIHLFLCVFLTESSMAVGLPMSFTDFVISKAQT